MRVCPEELASRGNSDKHSASATARIYLCPLGITGELRATGLWQKRLLDSRDLDPRPGRSPIAQARVGVADRREPSGISIWIEHNDPGRCRAIAVAMTITI